MEPGESLLGGVAARVRDYDLVELAMFVRKLDQAKGAGAGHGTEVPWLAAVKKNARKAFTSLSR